MAGRNGGRKRIEDRDPVTYGRACRMIDKALPDACKAIIDALTATYDVPQIIGRDEKGRPQYEYVEKPDHRTRVKAAQVLINKRIGDVTHVDHGGTVNFVPLDIMGTYKNAATA